MTTILVNKSIGPVALDCILREEHTHRLGITRVPIESGAAITDHAYVEPKRLRLEFADGNAADTFNALSRFMEQRVPFSVVSGLFVYSNMLIEELGADRDEKDGRILRGFADLHEAVIVETAYAESEGGDGGKTKKGSKGGKGKSSTPSKGKAGDKDTADRASGTVNRGDSATKPVAPAENKSILKQITGG